MLRLANELARQQEEWQAEAELQQYRALALQQQKWEAREECLEQQLRRYMAQEERLEGQLWRAGDNYMHGVPKQLIEPLEVVRADATLVKVKKETAGARSQPPPLISGSETMSLGTPRDSPQ